jgi:hypothetical protein
VNRSLQAVQKGCRVYLYRSNPLLLVIPATRNDKTEIIDLKTEELLFPVWHQFFIVTSHSRHCEPRRGAAISANCTGLLHFVRNDKTSDHEKLRGYYFTKNFLVFSLSV